MSDVQSNVKPLTLTTGRVIFAIAGVYVTQSLVSVSYTHLDVYKRQR